MFEGLKKKFSNFIGSITKKEEEKAAEEALPESADRNVKKEEIQGLEEPEKRMLENEIKDYPITTEKQAQHEKPRVKAIRKEELREEAEDEELRPHILVKKTAEREERKVTMGTRIKGIFLKEVRISEGDINPFMEDLRQSLLESDVNYNVAEKILEEMRKELLSRPLSTRGIEREITDMIRNSIMKTLASNVSKDILSAVAEKKAKGDMPFRILFIGPNGAGKTTTIAKVANMLKKNGVSCMISASDTFRAAAIEQTVYHANKLGVEVVKGSYGADPASIAFDAVAHAKSAGIEVVLIDSAGRQETNRSLMEEMKKMVRVAKPDMKIFIGESITGNALLSQVSQFKEAIGLDGVILTKLDADAKGGNTLSIISETSVPILYFGIGQGYDDIMPYSPDFIINNIIPN